MREKGGFVSLVPHPLSANVVVCAEVLKEAKTDLLSAIRIASVITVPKTNQAHFYSVAFVSSSPGDHESHVMSVQMNAHDGIKVASAPDYRFTYGYRVDPNGNGGFSMNTEFGIDVSNLEIPGTFWVWVYVDGEPVAKHRLCCDVEMHIIVIPGRHRNWNTTIIRCQDGLLPHSCDHSLKWADGLRQLLPGCGFV